MRADMSVDEQAKRQKHWEGRKRGSNSDKWNDLQLIRLVTYNCFG